MSDVTWVNKSHHFRRNFQFIQIGYNQVGQQTTQIHQKVADTANKVGWSDASSKYMMILKY